MIWILWNEKSSWYDLFPLIFVRESWSKNFSNLFRIEIDDELGKVKHDLETVEETEFLHCFVNAIFRLNGYALVDLLSGPKFLWYGAKLYLTSI